MNENKYLEQQNKMNGENSFMKTLFKKRLNQKGLTLIELLAVIVILAIIAAIAIPAISNLIANQRDKAVLADASTIISSAKLAVAAGVCGLEADATTACDQDSMTQYVDGIEGNYSVVTGDNGIEVTYDELDREWNLDPAPLADGVSTITEDELNEFLN